VWRRYSSQNKGEIFKVTINNLYKFRLQKQGMFISTCFESKFWNFGISIRFSCKHWKSFSQTPFWLSIKAIEDNKWTYAKEAREKLKAYENSIPKNYLSMKAGMNL
jgi:hypothetical protein